MKYELAKKLKDAHWVQGFEAIHAVAPNGKILKNYMLPKEFIPFPTLSELIEACTKERNKFSLRNDTLTVPWSAYRDGAPVNSPGYVGNGETPEEAVAMLWLALNTKIV